MDCPRCGRPNARYKERRPKKVRGTKKHPRTKYSHKGSTSTPSKWVRTDFTIECETCGEFDEYGRKDGIPKG